MRAAGDGGAGDLHTLQEELKKLGISVVSGRQDTVISVKIKGLAGRSLVRGLRLADQLLQEKIKHAIKACTDPSTKLFTDPTFGPSSSDPDGASAICTAGGVIPSKGGSQHQAKVLGLLQRGKIRWERPIYASDSEGEVSPQEDNDEDDNYTMSSTENVFSSNAKLFADGVSSGDVIQGCLGDCWFLSALSVVATRSDLLEQTFWRKDQHKSIGLFVCKFMKNFVWNYVLIDDRLPVYGFTDKKPGKPYFARCHNPNELWVSLLEKAYAKLHGSYEALIGGFVDCGLNDLTGMCAEQVILKEEFPGFGEDPYAPAKPQQKHGDPFWEKITRYKQSGTLMGCSIQPSPTTKEVAVESSAGNGLYFRHAYALVDAAEIKTVKGESVRLVKLRNPWGMGEWTGPWSDSSDERAENEDAIQKFFKIMKRKVGANAEKRVFMTLNNKGMVGADEVSQEDVIDINANDGTFFMSFDAWMLSFTHFFAGIDFPDSWHGRRAEGSWNEANCGGNTTKSTWINNPHFELVLEQRARIFASLSQEDPRGSANLKIVPVGFHICSLSPVGNDPNKVEIREPTKKVAAYYRLYNPEDREGFQTGKWIEQAPPPIIPGTVIPGIDEDGVPQAAYTFKQAVSVEATMEPGRYCIIPSMYMRTDKSTGKINIGSFWISVYSDKPTFRLEGGEKIVEEEEGDDEPQSNNEQSQRNLVNAVAPIPIDKRSISSLSKRSDRTVASGNAITAEKRRKYENDKEELLRQAKRYGVGLRELRVVFARTPKIQKAECRYKLQKLGFNVASWDDEKIGLLFGGPEDPQTNGMIHTDRILKLFTPNIKEEKMACELPDMEEEGDTPDSIHREGILEIELHGASGLAVGDKRQFAIQRKVQIHAPEFSVSQIALRRRIAAELIERDSSMAWHLRHFAKMSALLTKTQYASLNQNLDGAMRSSPHDSSSPVARFYELLEKEYANRLLSRINVQDEPEHATPTSRTPVYSKKDGMALVFPGFTSNGSPGWTQNAQSSNVLELHKSDRIRELETKRSAKFSLLLQHKQQALGDAEKIASLPRLIGGRKSGSCHINCVDCGIRVLVGGRSNRQPSASDDTSSFPCSGANCVNVFCPVCYSLLPLKSKLCEECYQHELSPEETFGEQLRVVLIEKIGASDEQRSHLEDIFRSFDVDGSGSLSPQEFEKMLQLLNIQPALTPGQKAFLVDQFDANGDGEISLTEFRHWILRDHVWMESALPVTSRENKPPTASEVFDTVVSPVLNEIIDLAYNAFAFSSSIGAWSCSSSTTTECQINMPHGDESGVIIFQRVVSLDITSGVDTSAAEKMFQQVDDDGSGSIDQIEFLGLLSALGIQLNSEDAILLMNRLCASSTDSGRITIEKSAFLTYVGKMSTKSSTRIGKEQRRDLCGILIKLNEFVGTGPAGREHLQNELQQLHQNMTHKDLINVCKTLDEQETLIITVDELRSLATNLTFDYGETSVSNDALPESEGADQLVSLKSSGDILARLLLSESSDLIKHVKTFDVASVCNKVLKHLQTRSGTNSTKSMWKSVFGADITDAIYLRDFISGILKTGFLIDSTNGLEKVKPTPNNCLITSLLLALAVDAVRFDSQVQPTTSLDGSIISFNLFRLIMRFQKIKEIELKFDHALTNFLQLCQGEQRYFVTIALDANRNLILRVKDPIFKFSADLILGEDEYDYQNLITQLSSSDFERRQQQVHEVSRELSFAKSPYGLITEDFHPELNNSMLTIIERIRADFCRRNVPHSSRLHILRLAMVESTSFLTTLRSLLSQVELPFFWSVSPRSLVLSIDGEYLDQQSKPSFQQLVADTLSLHGTQLPPPLRALATFVAHTASSLLVRYEVVGKHTNVETSWQEFQDFIGGHQNAYAVMQLHPYGSLFTTRVARATGSGSVLWNFKTQIKMEEPKLCDHRIDRPVVFTDTVKVSCVPGSAPLAENINFIVGDSDKTPGHFVVVSVRRALPSGPESPKPRLYCTAYDPLTSCDYMVVGYPLDWPVDFFDVTVNPSFESKWQMMLSMMRLGETITPKLAITVFNKQAKTDKIIGECEVSVGSAIAQEGHIFEERIALHPRSTPTTGDSIASSEKSRLQALEQVKQLQAQVQQLTHASNKTSEDTVERWKRRLDQARQEQFTAEEEHATRLAVLQEEIRRLTEENKQQKNAPREASNLKDCRLAVDAPAHDILSAMRTILTSRCPERPYHGLKKALAAEAEVPGKVTFAVFNDVLGDFGLALSLDHRSTLLNLFDPEMVGRVSIEGKVAFEHFFIKLCGDAEAYEKVKTKCSTLLPQSPTPEPSSPVEAVDENPEPVIFTPTPPPVQRPISPIASPLRTSGVRSKMSWQDMKKFLVLNLPEGWETRFTEKGRPYFCNHANRSTQWKHPRPEIETIFIEWVQENGAYFNRKSVSARASRSKH
ncbi:Cysteine protease family C02 [Phytophthora palmivora]|uniref:Cysteine protease family C02 n=1 Tax=Phytophthora palmivora TaxID=4796 RepID=A0A2P4XFM9_9STRA|nr:Cysteine protease family C02 [Phytophthora palmivora]